MGSPLSAFGSPPPVLGSARSGSLVSRGTESLALSIERGLPVTTRATLEMTNCELRVDPKAGVSVSVDVEDIYKKTEPRTWRPFPNAELYYYRLDTVSLCNTNMQPFLRKRLGIETGELGIAPTWFSVGSQEGHKPTPDPTPMAVALSGVWCNSAHDEYTNFFVRLYRNGTLTFVGAPPPHIDNLDAALDFPMAILRLFVHELIRDEATRDQILDSEMSTYSNITGGLQFNGHFKDMASTAVASTRWKDVDLSYEPGLDSCNKFYITKLHGAAEYLLKNDDPNADPKKGKKSKITMGITGHVQILGAKCLTDLLSTVASAEDLIHDLVNNGHIKVTGKFSQNPRKKVNKLSDEDLRTISPTAIRATAQLGSDMQHPLTRGNRPDDIAEIENAMRVTADPLPFAPGEWQGDPLQCPGSVTRSTRRVSISTVPRELFTGDGPVQSDSLCPPGLLNEFDEQQLLAVGETITPFDHGTSGEFHIPPDTVSLICLRPNGEYTMSERQVTPRAINNHDIRTLLTPRTREVEHEPPITAADDLPITAAPATVADIAEEAAEEATEEAAGQYRTPRADTPRKDGNPFAHFLDDEDSDSSDEDTLMDREQAPTPEAVLPEAVQTPVPEAAVLTEAVLTEAVLPEAVQTPATEADDDTPIARPVTKRRKRTTKPKQPTFTGSLPESFKPAFMFQNVKGVKLFKDMPDNIWLSTTDRKVKRPIKGDPEKTSITVDFKFFIWDSENLCTQSFPGTATSKGLARPHVRSAADVWRHLNSLNEAEAADSLNEAEDPEDPEVALGNLDDDATIKTTEINALKEQLTTAEQKLQERRERLEVAAVAATRPEVPTTEVPTQEEAPQEVRVGFVKRVPSFTAVIPQMWPPQDINILKRAMKTHKDVSPMLKKRKMISTTFNACYTKPISVNHIRDKVLHIEKMATPEAELVPTTEVPVRWSPDATISLKTLMRRFRHSGHNDKIDAIYDSLNQQMAGIPPGMRVQAPARFTKVDIARKIAQIERDAQKSAGFRSPPAPSS